MTRFKLVTNDKPKGEASGNGNNEFDLDKYLADKQAVIDLMETQNASEVLSGVVSGYIDLGIQPRLPYEEVYKADDKKH